MISYRLSCLAERLESLSREHHQEDGIFATGRLRISQNDVIARATASLPSGERHVVGCVVVRLLESEMQLMFVESVV
jgi:hypothetical protein